MAMLKHSHSKRILFMSLVALSSILFLFRDRWLVLIGDFSHRPGYSEASGCHSCDRWRGLPHRLRVPVVSARIWKNGVLYRGQCEFHLSGHGARARERALVQGIPLAAIASDDSEVMSTYMEAELLKEWIGKNTSPVQSIIVVSDPFHMRRARWAYQKVFGDEIQIQMAPVPFELTPYQSTWWKDVKSRKYVQDEYFKFIFYLFRYQYGWGFLKDWLASFDTH
jgi:hypothetical protein